MFCALVCFFYVNRPMTGMKLIEIKIMKFKTTKFDKHTWERAELPSHCIPSVNCHKSLAL